MGPLEHLIKEAKEAHAEASGEDFDLSKLKKEIADCLFLVFDAAHRAGMSYAELTKVAMAKLKENKQRKWPDWRTMDPNKAIEHDRTVDSIGSLG